MWGLRETDCRAYQVATILDGDQARAKPAPYLASSLPSEYYDLDSVVLVIVFISRLPVISQSYS